MVDISDLMRLAKLFKHGFAIEVKDGEIHHNARLYFCYPDAIPVITITDGKPTYHNGKIPDNCIINGYPVSKKNEYHIELVEVG